MPRSKPSDTIEHRITLGTKERQLLEDISTSYRISSLDPVGAAKILEDPTRVIQIGYGIATVIEMLGIETGLPTPVDLQQWLTERDAAGQRISESGQKSLWQNITEFLTGTGDFEGTWPGGY